MLDSSEIAERDLRQVLEARGQRYTAQRAAVHRFLSGTDIHPTAEEVFLGVRGELPGISLATVYKSLETLVGCGLAQKLTYGDTSARYDGRTDPHLHARCLGCGRVADVPGRVPAAETVPASIPTGNFRVTGYRVELTGYCAQCDSGEAAQA
jgi:Fe2+ or Zn2+ uptake regulation protein